ncbi:MAG: endonuclease MutS2 [Lachnospiraceae bacterium]|nr:endonuclease MutS2 [Lachnospiraceae bacterium]
MRNRNFRILEYDKIIEQLSTFASSNITKKRCIKLHPYSNLKDIERMQEETEAALMRLYRFGNLSFAGITDIRPLLHVAKLEGTLNTREMLDIARLLEIVDAAKSYTSDSKTSDKLLETDCIEHFFDDLEPINDLLNEIRRIIVSVDEIADDASPALKSIRKNVVLTNSKIRSELNKIVTNPNNQTMLQEALVTQRNGRFCIPIRAEYKNSFPGMIHDQSSTGSTIFIEPMAVVNLNNDLAELAIKEQAEIAAILKELTKRVNYDEELILANYEILIELDFIFARARFAKSYDGTRPEFNDKGIIDIKKARHPLLDKKTVVPIDINLGGDFTMLIITGPNTGGKTVSLKTLGLFTLMGESGLHIPAAEGSRLSLFDRVYADIGDEQSIELSLSTFSSHMTNIVRILKAATNKSLVLFDELGGGTDPTEGAALAIAILSHLHKLGAHIAATTHYSELKVFALSSDGVENACCEFNVETLQPTYKLLIGVPGKSNAFAISKKLGLPESIIEAAKSEIDETSMDFEKLLSDLEENRVTLDEERQKAEELRKEIEELRAEAKETNADINKRKDKILKKAREEAKDIIEKAKSTADESIRLYNKWSTNPEKASNKAMEYERTHLRKELNKLDNQLIEKPKKKKKTNTNHSFSEGDYVYIESMGLEGYITSEPDKKGDCYVQAGILKTLANTADLTLTDAPKEEKASPTRHAVKQLELRTSVKTELNLLGKTVDEAISVLDKYLDDAYLARLNTVTIIHGKGTGALRSAVQDYLKHQKTVKSFRSGEYGEGDAGVTVVEFK